MHVLHYIAINAMTKELAFDQVSDSLEAMEDTWFDWYVIGGGRFYEGNAYESNRDNVISYIDDRVKYIEAIKLVKDSRIESMNKYLTEYENYKDTLSSDMVEFISNGGQLPNESNYDLRRYYVSKALKLLDGHWGPDSMFYDITDGTANFSWSEQRLTDHNKDKLEFLVPVDFHF